MGTWTPGLGATAGDDLYTGGSSDDAADGLAGNDVLNGGDGNDILIGGEGNDALNGGEHPDRLIGDAGADQLNGGSNVFGHSFDVADYLDSPTGVMINLTTGAISGGHAQGDTIVAVEALVGSNFGDDALIGDAEHNLLVGSDGDDWLEGLAGNDSLAGGRGDDLLFGGDGDDPFTFSATRHAGAVGEAVATNSGTFSLVSLYLDADNIADMTIQVVHGQGVVMTGSDFVL